MGTQILMTSFSVVACVFLSFAPPVSGEILHEFITLDWEWPNDTTRQQYIDSGDFVPELCQISGIEVDTIRDFYSASEIRSRIFVTVPKMRSVKGVPAGLNTVHKNETSNESFLRPYPNWEWQKQGDCSALQFPMSMAMDPNTGYLYVIDVGRVGVTTSNADNSCPPKLVVFDTRRSNDAILSYVFPDSVVSATSNFLNDITLDYVDPEAGNRVRYAYITDTFDKQIVVFDFSTNTSWSFQDLNSMGTDGDRNITIQGTTYTMDFAVNGISLSSSFNYLYYSSVGSRKLFQVPTWVLRKEKSDFSKYVRLVGTKKSNSDAIIFGHRNLYFGALAYDAVYRWDLVEDLNLQGVSEGEVTIQTQLPLAQNWETMQWVDGMTIGFDNQLYFITERAQLFHTGTMDFSGKQGANFRIFTYPIADKSYLSLPKAGHDSVIVG
ncbi:major royal jelly protein 1 [Aplysia californica]|uniref:Major royal jelly protein 1 n=1 Tax=Aplysia californica TaxID=6500 RepID=A0ABM1A476_APLCA|nr:major royal jelly protein 1 [Aplysia californica]